MNLILLGGNGIDNKTWIEKVEASLKPLFESTKTIYYDHWQSGEWMINLDKEKEKLSEIAKDDGAYVIFAKSVGSLVAVKAIAEKLISPQKCIFVGVPLKWARKNNFDIDSWYQNFPTPTMVIQHSNDPFATSKESLDFFSEKSAQHIKFEELPGDTHDYNEFETIQKLVSGFVKQTRRLSCNL